MFRRSVLFLFVVFGVCDGYTLGGRTKILEVIGAVECGGIFPSDLDTYDNKTLEIEARFLDEKIVSKFCSSKFQESWNFAISNRRACATLHSDYCGEVFSCITKNGECVPGDSFYDLLVLIVSGSYKPGDTTTFVYIRNQLTAAAWVFFFMLLLSWIAFYISRRRLIRQISDDEETKMLIQGPPVASKERDRFQTIELS